MDTPITIGMMLKWTALVAGLVAAIGIVAFVRHVLVARSCSWCSYLVKTGMMDTHPPCYICGTRSPGKGNPWLKVKPKQETK